MHTPLRAAALAALAPLLAACISIRTPLDTNLDETKLGDKVGRAHWQSILGLVAWGDSGVAAAAKDGGITTATHADQEMLAILFFVYYRQTTVLHGY